MDKNRKPKFRQALALLAFAALAASFVCTEAILYQRNTIYFNGNWTSTKTGLARGVVGAVAFVTTRTALSGNRLDLGAWHGLNELTYNERLKPKSVEFNFRLQGHAYLIFEYNRTSDGFSGIRISRSKHFGHLLFSASSEGAFSNKQPLPDFALKDGWNHFLAEFEDGRVSFFVNGGKIATDDHPPLSEQWIGFRSSTDPTWVDGFKAVQRDGLPEIRATFRNTKGYAPTFAACFAVLLLLGCIPFLVGGKRVESLYAGVMIELLIFCAAGAFYGVDFAWISKIYPQSAGQIDRWVRYVAINNFKSNMEGDKEIVDGILKAHSSPKKGTYRIFFIGSSQTWGAGAASLDDVFSRRIEAMLNSNPGLKQRYGKFESINSAVSGAVLKDQWLIYFRQLAKLKPDLVLINMSNNDGNAGEFERQLKNFAQYDAENGIKTMFVLEANYLESYHGNVFENHEIMRKMADRYRLPVVDMQTYMSEHADEGMAWWDDVHMTSFGQRLVAGRLYREIVGILGSGGGRPASAGR